MTREEWLRLSAVLGMGTLIPANALAAPAETELKRSDFGPDFVWGTATAAYQVEGGWNEDGKGESNWDHFCHYHKHKIKTGENGDVACDFYHRFESDIELMHKIHIPASRFSIAWSRILPEGTGRVNQKGIDFYNKVIDKGLAAGIKPWITCYHWDIPQVLEAKGGWANRDSIKWFEEFVNVCAIHFGDRAKDWMVFNEPDSFVVAGYLLGIHPPGGGINFKRFYAAMHHVVMGHGAGGRVLRQQVKNANIGTTFSCIPMYAWKDKGANLAAAKRLDVISNRVFIEPILGMGYPVKDLPALKHAEKHILTGDEERMKFDFDFIGLQNYTRWVVKNMPLVPAIHATRVKPAKLGHELTEMGWEVYPEGMYRIIKEYAAYPGVKKIYLTENGAAFKDQIVNNEINDVQRIQYLKDYLQQILKAKKEGVNIGGYFIWSLLDNFEWAEGYRPKLGIVAVDFKTQQRTIKASGKWYSDFLKG